MQAFIISGLRKLENALGFKKLGGSDKYKRFLTFI